MKTIVERTYQDLVIDQDLGLGMTLWMTHFFLKSVGTRSEREESGDTRLDVDRSAGLFLPRTGSVFDQISYTNFGVSVGLQAVKEWPDRVARVNRFSEN